METSPAAPKRNETETSFLKSGGSDKANDSLLVRRGLRGSERWDTYGEVKEGDPFRRAKGNGGLDTWASGKDGLMRVVFHGVEGWAQPS